MNDGLFGEAALQQRVIALEHRVRELERAYARLVVRPVDFPDRRAVARVDAADTDAQDCQEQ